MITHHSTKFPYRLPHYLRFSRRGLTFKDEASKGCCRCRSSIFEKIEGCLPNLLARFLLRCGQRYFRNIIRLLDCWTSHFGYPLRSLSRIRPWILSLSLTYSRFRVN